MLELTTINRQYALEKAESNEAAEEPYPLTFARDLPKGKVWWKVAGILRLRQRLVGKVVCTRLTLGQETANGLAAPNP